MAAPSLIVLGVVADRDVVTGLAAQHALRAVFPRTVAELVAALDHPAKTMVLLLPPLADAQAHSLAEAIRRLYPFVPIAIALGPCVAGARALHLLWLTSEHVLLDVMHLAAEIAALATSEIDRRSDDATGDAEAV